MGGRGTEDSDEQVRFLLPPLVSLTNVEDIGFTVQSETAIANAARGACFYSVLGNEHQVVGI